jgi:hypothetical protein
VIRTRVFALITSRTAAIQRSQICGPSRLPFAPITANDHQCLRLPLPSVRSYRLSGRRRQQSISADMPMLSGSVVLRLLSERKISLSKSIEANASLIDSHRFFCSLCALSNMNNPGFKDVDMERDHRNSVLYGQSAPPYSLPGVPHQPPPPPQCPGSAHYAASAPPPYTPANVNVPISSPPYPTMNVPSAGATRHVTVYRSTSSNKQQRLLIGIVVVTGILIIIRCFSAVFVAHRSPYSHEDRFRTVLR